MTIKQWLAVLLGGLISSSAMAAGIQDVQSIEGSQRIALEKAILAMIAGATNGAAGQSSVTNVVAGTNITVNTSGKVATISLPFVITNVLGGANITVGVTNGAALINGLSPFSVGTNLVFGGNNVFLGSQIVSNAFTVTSPIYSTNSTTTNQFSTILLYPYGPTGQYEIYANSAAAEIASWRTNAHGGVTLALTNNTGMLAFRPISSTLLVSNLTFEAAGNVIFDGNTTIGDSSADSLTMNANTMTIVGQLGINNFMYITNSSVLFGASTPPANLVAKAYFNGNIRADNYFYNVLSTNYSATGTNSVDFSTNMVVNITGVTAGLTITSANLLAGRSVSIIFQGTTSNIALTLPITWVPLSQTFGSVVTNKMVAIHALALGANDSNVVYTITQQP